MPAYELTGEVWPYPGKGGWHFVALPAELAVQRGGGAEFAVGYEIIELVEPELIVLRSDPMPQAGMRDGTVLRVEFHDHGAKTRMTLSDGSYPAGRGHAKARWNAAFDKLAPRVPACLQAVSGCARGRRPA